MKTCRRTAIALFGLLAIATIAMAEATRGISNPSIDMDGFLAIASTAAAHRESHRLSEEDFLRLARSAGTIVLDARSREKYDELHLAGAINLSFPDIAIETLRRAIPDRSTRILIYCNNNIVNATGPFPRKLPLASLNLSTYIALYSYGYRNVWELAPQIDPADSLLAFEGTLQQRGRTDKTPGGY
jgi:rhodanese-like protein